MLLSTYEAFEDAVARAYALANAYYNSEGEDSPLEDEEYDALVDLLEASVEANPTWGSDSAEYEGLVNMVAAGTSGGDIKHSVPMLSLQKTKNEEGIVELMRSTDGAVVFEPKLDGIAISAKYVDGDLIQAVTRGDGSEGELVTGKMFNIMGLPARLNRSFTGEVRGEIYMTSEQFNAASAARVGKAKKEWQVSADKAIEAGREPKPWAPDDFAFSNSRNATSGLVNREGNAGFKYSLSFGAYDVISDENTDSYVANVLSLVDTGITPALLLLDEGDRTATADEETILSRTRRIGQKKDILGYPIDGAVLKVDSLSKRKEMGSRSKHPRWAIAFKYAPAVGISEVLEIIESVGRTGRLALKARITPVQVGTLLTYVSVHNVDWLTKKDIRVGDTVVVSRRNDVIPQIEQVITRPENSLPWVPPQTCPQCGETWNKDTLLWRCETPECMAANLVIHAAGREFFDWDGMSTAIITQMVDTELIDNIADVFDVEEEELAKLVMRSTKQGTPVLLGEKNAKKIYDRIQKSKETPLAKVIAALGIRTLGRTFGRRLAAHFGNMDDIRAASISELQEVEGIKDKAFVIHAGLHSMSEILDRLEAAGVNMVAEEGNSSGGSRVLEGKNVCVTGSMSGSALGALARPQVQELIESHGGRAASSVSSTTHILVAASQASSKYKKAVSLGTVQVLTPAEFSEMLGL